MIEPTRLLAIRHGETDWNVQLRIQGHVDIALNERGRRQAARLAAALADEPPAVVYSSDLQRARDTAAALAGAAGSEMRLHPGLRERSFGCFEGLTFAEVEQRWPEDAARWRRRDPDFAPPGGESLRAFHERATATVAALAAAHRGAGIAVVSHGGVLDCLYRAAVRVDLQAPRTWQLGNASINRLLHGAGGFVLVGWNDAAHLDAAD
ncbi:MAG: histidine phosphatase family protein [Rubrivivax sp.]|nr:histidine phosphatase family protein [Rubrivivax sp.]